MTNTQIFWVVLISYLAVVVPLGLYAGRVEWNAKQIDGSPCAPLWAVYCVWVVMYVVGLPIGLAINLWEWVRWG